MERFFGLEEEPRKIRKIPLTFKSDVKLYGELWLPEEMDENKGDLVLLLHPHPLFGGSMENIVISTIADVLVDEGFCVFRFNFRGVPPSKGSYAHGIGELKDAEAAYNKIRTLGFSQISLCGYSFGAMVAIALAPRVQLKSLILISPPLVLPDFRVDVKSQLPNIRSPLLIIRGSNDTFVSKDTVKELLESVGSATKRYIEIDGADHFYFDQAFDVAFAVRDFLKELQSLTP
ncbi:MAG: alpha/beta hydrolase [Candidatus Baldrarchaeia archaeon]